MRPPLIFSLLLIAAMNPTEGWSGNVSDRCQALLARVGGAFLSFRAAEPPFAEQLVRKAEAALKTAGFAGTTEIGLPEAWDYDGPNPPRPYETSFGPVLARIPIGKLGSTVDQILNARAARGLSNHVLDLYGSGFFVRDPSNANSITGLRFGPFKDDLQGRAEVVGDIRHPHTWKKLDESLAHRGIPSLDFVAMRPFGGWSGTDGKYRFASDFPLSQQMDLWKYILGNVLLRLHDHGYFLFQIDIGQGPGDMSNYPPLKDLIEKIEKNTPFKLVIVAGTDHIGNAYALSGALVPKVDK